MSAPLVVNTVDGTCWKRREATRDGQRLYAIDGAPEECPTSVMATYAELEKRGIAGQADVLPVPMGPQMPDFPPPPRTEVEKLHAERARLQDLLAEAIADKHRALRERDLIRERVSEPYGCAYCGEAKRHHGRRYLGSVGVHSWERPSDEQVKTRMLARRMAWMPLPLDPEIERVEEELTGANLALYEEELDNARLRLALKSAQRGRRDLRDRVAELEAAVRLLNTQRGDVALLVERERGSGEDCVDIDDLAGALALDVTETGGAR